VVGIIGLNALTRCNVKMQCAGEKDESISGNCSEQYFHSPSVIIKAWRSGSFQGLFVQQNATGDKVNKMQKHQKMPPPPPPPQPNPATQKKTKKAPPPPPHPKTSEGHMIKHGPM